MQNVLLDRLPAREKAADRLDGRAELFPLDGSIAGGRAGIDGEIFEPNRRPPFADHLASLQIDTRHRVVKQSGPRPLAKRRQVDVTFIKRIMTREKAGQHAGVSGVDLTRNHGEPRSRLRTHGELPQHLYMRVPATHQNDITFDRRFGLYDARFNKVAEERGSRTHQTR